MTRIELLGYFNLAMGIVNVVAVYANYCLLIRGKPYYSPRFSKQVVVVMIGCSLAACWSFYNFLDIIVDPVIQLEGEQ